MISATSKQSIANQMNIKVDNKKSTKSNKPQNKVAAKKIDFYQKQQSNEENDDILDDGIMILKLSKKGNEYVKPGSKNAKKNKLDSYTEQVLQKLGDIKHPKAKAVGKGLHNTEVKLDLEGLELKGMEIIKDLDEYYENVNFRFSNRIEQTCYCE